MTEEHTETNPTGAGAGQSEFHSESHNAEEAEIKNPVEGFIHHQRKAAEETFKALGALIPPEFRTHSREAGKEFLTSFKVLIEGTVNTIEHELNRRHDRAPSEPNPDSENRSGPSTTGKSKVRVEVS